MEKNDNPKKYKSAYILYSIEKRRKIKDEDPVMCNRLATKLIAEEWKKLTKMEKEKYIDLEKKEKEEFNEMKKEKKYSYKKTLNKEPTRYRTPYMFFISENKECLKGSKKYKNIENIKKLCEKWKAMTESDKLPYVQKALLDKERFKQEWDNYIQFYMRNKMKYKNKAEKEKYKNFINDLNNSTGGEFINKKLLKTWKLMDAEDNNNNEEDSPSKNKSKLKKPLVFFIEKNLKRKKKSKHEKLTQELKKLQNEKEERDIDDIIDEEEEEEEIENDEESDDLDIELEDNELSEEAMEEQSN